jgi:D-2-hydroxyacid dehydrogenase (NADP+)
MDIVLLQTPLEKSELDILQKEFPQYKYVLEDKEKPLSPAEWEQVAIVYGNCLSDDQIIQAPRLRWIHSPFLDFDRICLQEISQRGNILVTSVGEEDIWQIGEFVLAGIFAFAKNLFYWNQAGSADVTPENPILNDTWLLKDRVLLQIGLGQIGSEIARRAQLVHMRVWGVQQLGSFHAFCNRTIAPKDLQTYIPQADIICLCQPYEESNPIPVGVQELELMKEDSILIAIGAHKIENEQAIVKAALGRKLRGIILDAESHPTIRSNSSLWKNPKVLITPGLSSYPQADSNQAFKVFRHNLRQYVHGEYLGMRNRLTTK